MLGGIRLIRHFWLSVAGLATISTSSSLALGQEPMPTKDQVDRAAYECSVGQSTDIKVTAGLTLLKNNILHGNGSFSHSTIPSVLGDGLHTDASKVKVFEEIQMCVDLKLHPQSARKAALPDNSVVVTYPNGARYQGGVRNGMRNGVGILMWENGDSWEGEWRDDLEYGLGHGSFTYEDGSHYEGGVRNNNFEGLGTMNWPNGSSWEGQWRNGASYGLGHGARIYANGDRYEGGILNGKRNGYGIMFYENGCRLETQWRDNKANGIYVFTFRNGQTRQGEAKDGKLDE